MKTKNTKVKLIDFLMMIIMNIIKKGDFLTSIDFYLNIQYSIAGNSYS